MRNEPMKTPYAECLNALGEMQQSLAYAARRSVLQEAERLIVSLDNGNAALRQRIEELETQWHNAAIHDPEVDAIKHVADLTTQLAQVTAEGDEAEKRYLAAVQGRKSFRELCVILRRQLAERDVEVDHYQKEILKLDDKMVKLEADLTEARRLGTAHTLRKEA